MSSIRLIMASVVVLIAAAGQAEAGLITSTDVINNWTSTGEPIDNLVSGAWYENSGNIQGTANHGGLLYSDFTASGNFEFSVQTRVIDNDLFGMTWGYQDNSNNYRLSWGRTYRETPGNVASGGVGIQIVKEVAGVSSLLLQSAPVHQNHIYSLSVKGTASGFDLSINDLSLGGASVLDQSFAETTFTAGRVGIFEWYQGPSNVWSNFEYESSQGSSLVPEPTSFAIFSVMGLVTCGVRRRRRV